MAAWQADGVPAMEQSAVKVRPAGSTGTAEHVMVPVPDVVYVAAFVVTAEPTV